MSTLYKLMQKNAQKYKEKYFAHFKHELKLIANVVFLELLFHKK